MQKMFIGVIPFGGSIDDKGLTYFVQDELAKDIQIGCLVEVPFHNALDYAIVISKTSVDIPENPKSIVGIVTTTPLLEAYQIRSIFDSSSYYFVHVHHILSLFLSKTLVKYLEKKKFSALNSGLRLKNKISPNDIRFYHHTNESDFFKVTQKFITDRTVVIFPDDFSIDGFLKGYPTIMLDSSIVIQDKLTETKKHKTFISVYNGEKNIIIGTRRILYYNLSHYNNIVYIEDSLNKSAMRYGHRYKHLEILRNMSLNSHFNISILSTLPSIESMYLLHIGTYNGTKN